MKCANSSVIRVLALITIFVVFFLLKNEFPTYEETADHSSELAESLFRKIRIVKHTGNVYSGQFGALYLHASAVDSTLRLDHGDVLSTAFPPEIQLATKHTFVWPADNATNLAVATKDHKLGLRGHSEYLLLIKLAAMLIYFKEKHQQACPRYIVIFTKLPPCRKANDPNKPAMGCTPEIIEKFNKAKARCPDPATKYVVGHHDRPKPEDATDWEKAKSLLTAQDIFVTEVAIN